MLMNIFTDILYEQTLNSQPLSMRIIEAPSAASLKPQHAEVDWAVR